MSFQLYSLIFCITLANDWCFGWEKGRREMWIIMFLLNNVLSAAVNSKSSSILFTEPPSFFSRQRSVCCNIVPGNLAENCLLFKPSYIWTLAIFYRHWQDLGYLIVYVTGRPDMQKQRVVAWLSQHNFPHGIVSFCDGLVHDPLRHKANFLKSLISEVASRRCLI